METYKENINKYVKKLQEARFSLMRTHPFYAVLLMHINFGLDNYAETAYTDGKLIAFAPDFLDKLSNNEVQFVLMHEVMHIVLNHCNRLINGMDLEIFNIACDIVVNSNILYSFNKDVSKITVKEFGEMMHLTPDGKEGYDYTAEEVYQMLLKEKSNKKNEKGNEEKSTDKKGNNSSEKDNFSEKSKSLEEDQMGFDDHSYWKNSNDQETKEEWKQIAIEAKKMQDEFDKKTNKSGSLPMLLERQIDEYIHPQTNWREILHDFIQIDIVDYSFNPPDRRMQDNSLILPDFNEKEEIVKNIWFIVDTSGSIGKKELTIALSEIKGALDQFNNHLEAQISFFDADITEPMNFSSIKEFQEIKAVGGGGTSFQIIFEKLDEYFKDEKPSYIIILTDGCAIFPQEEVRQEIPVLWLINNEYVTPPWGKVGRIKLDD